MTIACPLRVSDSRPAIQRTLGGYGLLPTALHQRNRRRTPLAQSPARLTLLCDNTTLRNAAVWPQRPNSDGRVDCPASAGHCVSAELRVRRPSETCAASPGDCHPHVHQIDRQHWGGVL